MIDLEPLRERYLQERPQYESLALVVRSLLEDASREIGLACRFEHRAKAVDSFLKKALRGAYASPYEDIKDKAGVRVIAPFYSQVEELATIVRDRFRVDHFENKKAALAYNELGYLGVHFEVRLLPDSAEPSISELTCEVQLHTAAQTAWADVSHDLVYKPPEGIAPPPEQHQRSVYRLVAFVEVFDEEADRALQAMTAQERFGEARMLLALERPFYRLFAKPFDPELSIKVLSVIAPTYDAAEISRFPGLIEDFVSRNEVKLRDLLADYGEDERRSPLLFQPETLAVFERLDSRRLALQAAWNQALPRQLLEGLSEIWGEAV